MTEGSVEDKTIKEMIESDQDRALLLKKELNNLL